MRKTTLSIFTALLMSGCVAIKPCDVPAPVNVKSSVANDVNDSIAAETALYAMMSANVYPNSKIKFPLDQIGWRLAYSRSNDNTGLAYDVMKSDRGETVFVIRGTDNVQDWEKANFALGTYSPQYSAAENEVAKYLSDLPKPEITAFTGHSLGGGIALYLSSIHGSPAYAIDASPRIFDAEHRCAKPAKRILIFQNGEVMEKARDVISRDWQQLVDVSYRNNTEFAGCKGDAICLHSSDKLALALLKRGRKTNSELEVICNALPECR